MSDSEPIQQFIKWIQGFDYRILQNIDDVETNFILPMFRYLRYPERCRQSKFIVHGYQPENGSTKLEVDQVYFATDNFAQQNADTSLVMVAAQQPHHSNFSPVIAQLRLYSIHLRPFFFIVTNGYHVQVLQCWRYRREYSLFDTSVDILKNQEFAANFYQSLNFHYVKSLNKNTNNLLNFNHHVLLEKFLRRDPHLQNLLTKFDFQPEITRDGNHLIVVKPKVAIKCNLPQALGRGNCEIEFSNIVFRGIRISINHQNILGCFMTGMNTQPHWKCRPFIKQVEKNAFEAYLGQTILILSEVETIDLCLCIDEICQQYKNSIIDFENNLQTWEFEFVEFSGIRGFQLFDVDSGLWELMYKFAHEFDYAKGKTEWHLFHQENFSIRLSRGIRDSAFIVPKISSHSSLLVNNQISLIYEINEVHLKSLEKKSLTSWQQDIGPLGTWTARYTKQWLLEKYIPKVIDYYSQQTQLSEEELLAAIKANQYERPSLKEIDDIKDLLPYLRDIQSWLNLYIENIAAVLLRSYYRAFTDLVRNTDSAIDGMDYIMGNLSRIYWQNGQDKSDKGNSIYRKSVNFKNVVSCLDEQVKRINNDEYETSLNADLLTRIFIWIIEKGKINCSQPQMNAAKQALLPLWEQSRFEMRHVYPNR
ncbi:MAG: hypothetical protein RMX68_020915 [Aulosira sp. ZfuVER01]|nr:hypothetical protein [Aulosira sp. ZfuVER01]MDZ8002587.1 hypothetical protein [Aulosira sp. DedVER01a]MDZ8050735.1 hypothetical protein [Aulosira sp. ZfuCHP01]